MRQLFLLSFLLILAHISYAQLAVYSFTGDVLTATSSDANVTASDATHSGLLNTTSFFSCVASDSWSPSSWSTSGSVNISDDYAEYTITANIGFDLTVTGFTFFARRSSTGPQSFSIRSSNDNYASDLLTGSVATSCTSKGGSFSSSITVTAGNTLTIRIYGYNASGAGNMRMDDVTITGISAAELPVELVKFTAESIGKSVKLEWQTASETNNEGFDIQRSTDGKNWETLYFILGNGTTTEISNYEYLDNEPISGINYYRLKQIDYDGQFEYSRILNLEYLISNDEVKLFTNPVQNELNVVNGKGIVTIYNMLGQPMEEFIINNEQFLINTSDLAKGQYMLSIQKENGSVVTKRFIRSSLMR